MTAPAPARCSPPVPSPGGTGTGGGLGNQGAVTLSDNGRQLYVVNAGSDQISAFEVTPRGLRRTAVVGSGGHQPISATVDGRLLYVLNAGRDQITGFIVGHGSLTPLAGSTRPLSGSGTGPAEVQFDRGGDLLAVTEKATGHIDTYTVGRDGRPSAPHVQNSAGQDAVRVRLRQARPPDRLRGVRRRRRGERGVLV